MGKPTEAPIGPWTWERCKGSKDREGTARGPCVPFTGLLVCYHELLVWSLHALDLQTSWFAPGSLHSNWSCSHQWELAFLSIVWSPFPLAEQCWGPQRHAFLIAAPCLLLPNCLCFCTLLFFFFLSRSDLLSTNHVLETELITSQALYFFSQFVTVFSWKVLLTLANTHFPGPITSNYIIYIKSI